MSREFGLHPWDIPRLTQREFLLVNETLNKMAGVTAP